MNSPSSSYTAYRSPTFAAGAATCGPLSGLCSNPLPSPTAYFAVVRSIASVGTAVMNGVALVGAAQHMPQQLPDVERCGHFGGSRGRRGTARSRAALSRRLACRRTAPAGARSRRPGSTRRFAASACRLLPWSAAVRAGPPRSARMGARLPFLRRLEPTCRLRCAWHSRTIGPISRRRVTGDVPASRSS